MPVTRITVAAATEQLADDGAAEAWLERTAGDPEARAGEVRTATRVLNRALNALRAAARDPLVQEVGATRALAVRIGFGSGEQLAEGLWTEARELPPPRRSRLDDVDPQTRVAAVLGGREEVSPGETLLLRARLDLNGGRLREAALQLPAAARQLLRDSAESGGGEGRAELEALLPAIDDAAAAALTGEPPADLAAAVRDGVEAARGTLRPPG